MLPLVEGMMADATQRWPDLLAMAAAPERTSDRCRYKWCARASVGGSVCRRVERTVGPHRAQRSWCRPFAANGRCGVSRLHGSPHCESSVDILVLAPSGSETHERIANHARGAGTEEGEAVQLGRGTQPRQIVAVAVAAVPVGGTVAIAVAIAWRSRAWRGGQDESEAQQTEHGDRACFPILHQGVLPFARDFPITCRQ